MPTDHTDHLTAQTARFDQMQALLGDDFVDQVRGEYRGLGHPWQLDAILTDAIEVRAGPTASSTRSASAH